MEEYISHEDYKQMMDAFKQGTSKGLLKEGLEKEGNAFTAGLAKTKKGGEFKVGDKPVKDTSNYDSSMEEEMHSFDGIKKDTPHAHKLKVNAPNLTGTIFKNEDGTYVFYDVDNYNADSSLPPFKTITDLMKHFGIKMQDLQEDMEESHPGNDQWYEEFQTAISAMGLAGEAEARVMKALDHTNPMAQYGSMQAPEAAREFVNDLGIVSADDYDDYDADYEEPRDDFDMAGGDFNDGEFWEAEVKKFQEIAGVGPQDDGPEDDNDEERQKRADKEEEEDTEAENAEREIDEEAHADGSHMRNPDTVAKVVAEKHGAELKPLYDKYQVAWEQYIKDVNNKELSKAYNALVKEFQNDAINWAGHEMLEAGMKRVQVSNLLSGYGYFEDWLSDYITAIGKELKGVAEGLHMPPLQATGPTVDTNEGMHMPPLQATGNSAVKEDQAPFGMSVLSPDERKQLKEYINSMKTIKKEIASLLEKAGRSGKIMENLNIKKVEDEEVPAERPAHYNEPTKTPKHNPSNLGGNRTNLVMTKAEMWEGADKMETSLGEKLHSAFNKVTDMAIKQLVADGWDESQAASFLKVEIEERAKEAINAQYDMH